MGAVVGDGLAAPQPAQELERLVKAVAAGAGSSSSPKRVSSPPVFTPRPTPSTSRPPLSWSRLVVSRASFCGRRRATGVTSGPSRTVSVAVATAASRIHGSATGRNGPVRYM